MTDRLPEDDVIEDVIDAYRGLAELTAAAGHDLPPAQLDAAILEAAHRRSRPMPQHRAHLSMAAAIATLCVGALASWQLHKQVPARVPLPGTPSSADSTLRAGAAERAASVSKHGSLYSAEREVRTVYQSQPDPVINAVARPGTAIGEKSARRGQGVKDSPAPRTSVMDFSAMARRYGPAVVRVVATAHAGSGEGGSGEGLIPVAGNTSGLPSGEGEGAGFLVTPDGMILANAHLINGARRISVRLLDQREYVAQCIGVDLPSDVALIKINAKDLAAVQLGDTSQLRAGAWVAAIGAPSGGSNSVTAGIVGAQRPALASSGYIPLIRTGVPVNPGSSGSPLVDLSGKVVGINSQLWTDSDGSARASFAVPIELAISVMRQLQAAGHVARGNLGVQVEDIDQRQAQSLHLPDPRGALVVDTGEYGAAARAGIQRGDVITALNGHTVQFASQLRVSTAALIPGTTVRLQVWRYRAAREYSAQLTALHEGFAGACADAGRSHDDLGLAVRPLSAGELEGTRPQEGNGLVVEHVQDTAAAAGIERGDVILAVNGAAVSSAQELREAVSNSAGHFALLVRRGNATVFIPVRMSER